MVYLNNLWILSICQRAFKTGSTSAMSFNRNELLGNRNKRLN